MSNTTTPKGWKLVPVEPTPDMVRSGWEKLPAVASDVWDAGCRDSRLVYAAMLAAAPDAPAPTASKEVDSRKAFEQWYSKRYAYDFSVNQPAWIHAAMCDAWEVWKECSRQSFCSPAPTASAELAYKPSGDGTRVWTNEERRVGEVLLAAWQKAEPRHGVSLHPESYRATFFDMARAVLAAAPTAPAVEPLDDDYVEKLREQWLRSPADGNASAFVSGVRWAERAHGIGAPKEGGAT